MTDEQLATEAAYLDHVSKLRALWKSRVAAGATLASFGAWAFSQALPERPAGHVYGCPYCQDPEAKLEQCGGVGANWGGAVDRQSGEWEDDGNGGEMFWDLVELTGWQCRGCDRELVTLWPIPATLPQEPEGV